MKRTHLPLNGLRVLDAAARHLSFTRAADELAVTPAAVGQQIRALEDLLGVVLFRRTPKGLELTGEAAAGLDPLREGFLRFEEAVQAMQAGQSSHVYTIAVPRDFLGLWLAPKLAAFRREHPQVSYKLVGGDAELDFTEANLDLAVRWGEGPGELEGAALGEPARVVVAPRESDGDAPWIGWPGDAAPGGDEPALSVADAGLAIAAAAAGMGRARVPAMLADAALAAGQGIALGARDDCRKGYWLVAPTPQWRQKKVKELVGFLTAA
ncbi:MAG: LysR family transcriptional regulator [Novosphingobium sp.]|nr:LysR family transcriptional regulator [Novosphingobium sp.]